MKTKNQTTNLRSRSTKPFPSGIGTAFACWTALLAFGVGLLALPADGAILSWSGGGTTGNWSDSGNWGFAGTPGNGDTLIFSATQPRPVNTNNIASLTLNQIRFVGAGGGYAIFGNAITITNGIEATNSTGANVLSNNITLGSPTDFVVDVATGAKLTLGGTLNGSVGLIKSGGGTNQFAGGFFNTYAGTTTVSGGTLLLGKGYAVTSVPGPLIVNSGCTVGLLNSFQIYNPATPVSLADSSLFNLAGFSDWVGPITLQGSQITSGAGMLYINGDITVNASTVATSVISGNASIYNGTHTITNSGHYYSPDLMISANLTSGGSPSTNGLIKAGAGEVSLAGNNSFTGPVTVNGGSLWAQTSTALGNASTPATVNSGGELSLNGTGLDFGLKPLVLNGSGDGDWDSSGYPIGALNCLGSSSWEGPITLAGDSTIYQYAGASLTLNASISGPGGFTKSGPGTLIFSGSTANTYSGNTFMNEGTLLLGKTGFDLAIPHDLTIGDGTGSDVVQNLVQNQIANTSHVTINTGGLLDLNGNLDGIASLDMTGGAVQTGAGYLELIGAGGGITTHSSSVQASISGTLDLGAQVRTFDVPAGIASPELVVSAVVRNGGLTKASNGNLQLTGANTYDGLTTISNGFIEVANASALGSTVAGTVMANSGVSAYLLVEGVSVVGEALTNNSTLAEFRSSGGAGWSGNIVLNSQLDILPFGGTNNLSGVISGVGAVTKSQTGMLVYSGAGANTYTNTTTVIAGTLQLNKTVTDGAIQGDLVIGDGTGGANADIVRLVGNPQIATVCNVTIASSGLLDLNEISEGISTVSGSGEVDTGSTGTGALVINGNGSTTYSGLIIGTGDVFKSGTGTFTLAGNNTYSGLTTVNNGTLLVNGSQPQSPVSVSSIGTLGGSGTVGNITANGNIAPGNSPGILTSSNVVFTSTGDFFVELTGPTAGTGYDQLNVRGTNVLGNAVLHVTTAFTTPVAVSNQFVILNNDGSDAITGTFSGLANNATFTAGSYLFRINYSGTFDNDVTLTLLSVPATALNAVVTAGDGSHAIDPNGCNNLSLVITNTSGSAMTGINATLSTTTEGVIITQPYSTYPNTPASGKGTNSTPFQISTLPSFVCGTNITLQLSVDSSLGSFTMNFTLPSGESAAPVRFDNNIVTNVPDIGTIESTNNVAVWTGGAITKVAVSLWLVAPIDSDLSFSLIAPDGTTVPLSTANGAGANFGTGSADASRTTFDNSAVTAITAGSPPFVGTFRPQSPLSAFIGTSPVGNWRLHIQDSFGSGSPDTLRAWSLFLSGTSCSPGGGACDYCLTSVSNSITAGDLSQTNRISRNLVVASCGSPKPYPGSVSSSFRYDVYAFTNTSPAEACVTVLLTSACDVQAGVYLNSFDPLNITNNYLGDSGDSTSDTSPGPQSCSVTVPAGAKFLVSVNEITPGAGCGSYNLQLSGLPCPPPTLNIQPVSPNKARLFWDTSAGGYLLEADSNLTMNAWGTITNEPIVSGGNYNVTNTSVLPNSRFYRLHKP